MAKKNKFIPKFPVKEMGVDADYVRDSIRKAIDNSLLLSDKVTNQYKGVDKVPAQTLQTMSQLNDSVAGLAVTLMGTYKEHSKIRENELKNDKTERPDDEIDDGVETGEEDLNLFDTGESDEKDK